MEKTAPVKVLNRDSGSVVYSIPEMNGLRRTYQAGEIKEVTFEEIEKLSYIPGGPELLRDSLVILDNDEVIKEIVGETEPEYKYTKEDIINLLKNGTLDEFLDCLDFAPEGVLDLIKALAVELPLNDVSKRNAIREKLNFDIDNVIRIQEEATEGEKEVKPTHERRVKKTSSEGTTTRRVVKK